MLYEIDFHPTGADGQSGDAITLRYSADGGRCWTVGVIDGGLRDSGEVVCRHIRRFYHTDQVDFVVSSHPHLDHISGLSTILTTMKVGRLLMHCPWEYAAELVELQGSSGLSQAELAQQLKQALFRPGRLYDLARLKGIPIFHPFAGMEEHGIPCLTIAGPSRAYYLQQLAAFDKVQRIGRSSLLNRLLFHLSTLSRRARRREDATPGDRLSEPDSNAVSPENNSSTVLFFNFTGVRCLFTADAGATALHQALGVLEQQGFSPLAADFLQLPHHGSARNLGPSVLDRAVGGQNNGHSFVAFASACWGGHFPLPGGRVIDACIARGGEVFATHGAVKCCYSDGVPVRGWRDADALFRAGRT